MAEEFLSVRAYARRRGVSHTAVELAISTGRLERCLHRRAQLKWPLIDPEVADREWEANTHPGQARSGGAAPVQDDYRKTLVLERVVKTRLAQMRLDEEQGRLVDIAEVRRTFFDVARTLRNQLLELPERLADELALEHDAGRVRAIMVREIKDILRKLADRCAANEMKETAAMVQEGRNGRTRGDAVRP